MYVSEIFLKQTFEDEGRWSFIVPILNKRMKFVEFLVCFIYFTAKSLWHVVFHVLSLVTLCPLFTSLWILSGSVTDLPKVPNYVPSLWSCLGLQTDLICRPLWLRGPLKSRLMFSPSSVSLSLSKPLEVSRGVSDTDVQLILSASPFTFPTPFSVSTLERLRVFPVPHRVQEL